MELVVVLEELLAFGCPGDKVLPFPRGDSGGDLLSSSFTVEVLLGPS